MLFLHLRHKTHESDFKQEFTLSNYSSIHLRLIKQQSTAQLSCRNEMKLFVVGFCTSLLLCTETLLFLRWKSSETTGEARGSFHRSAI